MNATRRRAVRWSDRPRWLRVTIIALYVPATLFALGLAYVLIASFCHFEWTTGP